MANPFTTNKNDILPSSTDTYNLGAAGQEWNYVYAKNFVIAASGSISGNIIPLSDNTQDLGSSSLSWRTVYTNKVQGVDSQLNILAPNGATGGQGIQIQGGIATSSGVGGNANLQAGTGITNDGQVSIRGGNGSSLGVVINANDSVVGASTIALQSGGGTKILVTSTGSTISGTVAGGATYTSPTLSSPTISGTATFPNGSTYDGATFTGPTGSGIGTTFAIKSGVDNLGIGGNLGNNLTLTGGNGDTTNSGGSITLAGGNSIGGTAGNITLQGGTGSAGGSNGNIYIKSPVVNYNNIATVSGGIPAEYATVDLTAQGAAITTTTLYAVPSSGAGQYRVSWNSKVTTVDGTSSTLGALTISWTDPDSVAQSVTAAAVITAGTIATTSTGNTTTSKLIGIPQMLNCKASTNIQYAMAYVSNTPGQMQYNLHIKLEAM